MLPGPKKRARTDAAVAAAAAANAAAAAAKAVAAAVAFYAEIYPSDESDEADLDANYFTFTTCYGCINDLANQQAHMGPGGCGEWTDSPEQ
eukprot:COSAG05_NODE_2370_length_3162_cov_62.259876_2_plen_91_part_00